MNYTRTLNTWKVLHLARALRKCDHRVYSTVCLKRSFDPDSKRSLPLDKSHSLKYTTNKALDVTKQEESGFLKTFMNKVGWLDVNRSKQKFSGYLLFESVVDYANYEDWFTECKLPNTFLSWFVVTELHVWLLLVRCMAEGENGKLLRNAIIEAMWSDTLTKLGRLGSSAKTSQNVDQLSQEFQAALIGYDEGLLGDDIVLASALWRRFFQMSQGDAVLIENLVKYIRRQVKMLEEIPPDEFMNRPKIKWIPLVEKKV